MGNAPPTKNASQMPIPIKKMLKMIQLRNTLSTVLQEETQALRSSKKLAKWTNLQLWLKWLRKTLCPLVSMQVPWTAFKLHQSTWNTTKYPITKQNLPKAFTSTLDGAISQLSNQVKLPWSILSPLGTTSSPKSKSIKLIKLIKTIKNHSSQENHLSQDTMKDWLSTRPRTPQGRKTTRLLWSHRRRTLARMRQNQSLNSSYSRKLSSSHLTYSSIIICRRVLKNNSSSNRLIMCHLCNYQTHLKLVKRKASSIYCTLSQNTSKIPINSIHSS